MNNKNDLIYITFANDVPQKILEEIKEKVEELLNNHEYFIFAESVIIADSNWVFDGG